MRLIDDTRLLSAPDFHDHPPIVNFVIPCFNEKEVLPETSRRLQAMLDQLKAQGLLAADSAVYLIDDGSEDSTWIDISALAQISNTFRGIRLSRNCGHQNALLCGLMSVSGDALISLDADLQDDLSIVPQMIRDFRQGSEVVYAVRRRRETDSWFKRTSAESYYRLLEALGVRLVFNHADYRLLGRRPLEALRSYSEPQIFLRGMIPMLGFCSNTVEFDRAERFAGESKYPLGKMLALAWQGVTSFTAYPLRLITGAGALVSLFSLGLAGWAIWVKVFTSDALPGWASSVIPMYLLGGLQLLGLGVIGEYLAKVFEAGKQRPKYHVQSICGNWKPP